VMARWDLVFFTFNLALDPDLGPDPNRGSSIRADPDSV
jgi:hypothetical protein